MIEEEITKLCKETFKENIMSNLDSALIFAYIQTLEQENKQLKAMLDIGKTRAFCPYYKSKEQLEKTKQPQIFIDTDIEDRYGYELENDYLREQLQQRDEIIEEAIEYITSEEYFELNNYMSISESQNRANYFKAHDKLLDILNKCKGDNNEKGRNNKSNN